MMEELAKPNQLVTGGMHEKTQKIWVFIEGQKVGEKCASENRVEIPPPPLKRAAKRQPPRLAWLNRSSTRRFAQV